MVGVVLAAGYGKRLDSFSEAKHKCLVPLNGVCLIDYNLELLKEFGVERIVVVVGYNHDYIERHVGKTYQGIPVTYVMQEPPRGVADALRCSLTNIGSSPFFMCLADELLISPSLDHLKKAFQRPGVAGVCGIVKSDRERITKAYTLKLDSQNMIQQVLEKPQLEQLFNEYRGTGYCLINSALASMLPKVPKNAIRGEYEMCDWFTMGLEAGLKLLAAEIAVESVNINTKEDYRRAEAIMKGDQP